MKAHDYFVYFLTNASRTVLYTGVTNDLRTRLRFHRADAYGPEKTFAGKYKCVYLIYFEYFTDIRRAIDRETEIKKWSRKKKEALIGKRNPAWKFITDFD